MLGRLQLLQSQAEATCFAGRNGFLPDLLPEGSPPSASGAAHR